MGLCLVVVVWQSREILGNYLPSEPSSYIFSLFHRHAKSDLQSASIDSNLGLLHGIPNIHHESKEDYLRDKRILVFRQGYSRSTTVHLGEQGYLDRIASRQLNKNVWKQLVRMR